MTFNEASGVDGELEGPPVEQCSPVDGHGRMPAMRGLASECPGRGLHLAACRQGTAVCSDAEGVASSGSREEASYLRSLLLCVQSGHLSVSSTRMAWGRGHVQATSERGHWDLVASGLGLGCWGWSPVLRFHPQPSEDPKTLQ